MFRIQTIKHKKKKLFFSSIALFVFIQVIGSGCYMNFENDRSVAREQRTLEAEKEIAKDGILTELDSMCKEIPSIRGVEFVSKDITKHKKSVGFYYHSQTESVVEYAKLKDFYTNYLEERGWKTIADYEFGSKWVEFKKNNRYILVSTASDSGMSFGKTYAISCADYSYSMVE